MVKEHNGVVAHEVSVMSQLLVNCQVVWSV